MNNSLRLWNSAYFTVLIFAVNLSAPAAQRRSPMKWLTLVKPEKTPVRRVRCFIALSSGLMPPTPPPPVIRSPNAAADHQFVGAQLYVGHHLHKWQPPVQAVTRNLPTGRERERECVQNWTGGVSACVQQKSSGKRSTRQCTNLRSGGVIEEVVFHALRRNCKLIANNCYQLCNHASLQAVADYGTCSFVK